MFDFENGSHVEFYNFEFKKGFYRDYAKRGVDLFCLPILLICFLIAVVPIIVLNPFFNPGPLFFTQWRVGRHGQEFRILKFRSIQADGSISRPAHFMRRSRVDELPQLWNVLKGEMSIIGPRPEVPALVAAYRRELPYFMQRHAIRPGISGLAQLRVGYTDNAKGAGRKLAWDLYYQRHVCIWLDLRIFAETCRIVFAHLLKVKIKAKL